MRSFANDPSASDHRTSLSGRWARPALIGAWAVTFALLSAGVFASWDRLVEHLTRAPLPSLAPARVPNPARGAGDRALVEARDLIAVGESAEAARVLDAIPPQDPAYPFARSLGESARRVPPEERR